MCPPSPKKDCATQHPRGMIDQYYLRTLGRGQMPITTPSRHETRHQQDRARRKWHLQRHLQEARGLGLRKVQLILESSPMIADDHRGGYPRDRRRLRSGFQLHRFEHQSSSSDDFRTRPSSRSTTTSNPATASALDCCLHACESAAPSSPNDELPFVRPVHISRRRDRLSREHGIRV